MKKQTMDTPEFKIDDVVTVDRYNHIKDVQKGTIIGYGKTHGGTLTYKINIKGTTIETSGGSIMESKIYNPVPDDERHEPVGTREYREREAREDAEWFKRTKMK